MNLKSLLKTLADHPDSTVQFMLPERNSVPAHFHVTEVGRVQKDFIDCGGTVRSETVCVLQIWVANDLEHRISAAKLARIIQSASALLKSDDLPVEAEYESQTISRFALSDVEATASTVIFHLGAKHTACLAPDKCGLNILGQSECGPVGCC